MAWAPVVGWAVVVFGLSSIPGTRIPDVGFTFADKVAHIGVYGVLGALCYRALQRGGRPTGRPRRVLAAALLALAYGMTDEFHQMFVPNRSSELLDLAADLLGGTLGALVASSLLWPLGAAGTQEPPA